MCKCGGESSPAQPRDGRIVPLATSTLDLEIITRDPESCFCSGSIAAHRSGCFHQGCSQLVCSECSSGELDVFYPSPEPTKDNRTINLGFSRSLRCTCSSHPSSQLRLLAHQPLKFIDLLA